jgi:hypothetical protein
VVNFPSMSSFSFLFLLSVVSSSIPFPLIFAFLRPLSLSSLILSLFHLLTLSFLCLLFSLVLLLYSSLFPLKARHCALVSVCYTRRCYCTVAKQLSRCRVLHCEDTTSLLLKHNDTHQRDEVSLKFRYAGDINLLLREMRLAALQLEKRCCLKKQKMTE